MNSKSEKVKLAKTLGNKMESPCNTEDCNYHGDGFKDILFTERGYGEDAYKQMREQNKLWKNYYSEMI